MKSSPINAAMCIYYRHYVSEKTATAKKQYIIKCKLTGIDYKQLHARVRVIEAVKKSRPASQHWVFVRLAFVCFMLDVTTAAKAYMEVVYSLARSAQVCKGATSELGKWQ